MKNDYKQQTDQKGGWIIVFGNIICFFAFAGHLRSFGIFVVPIQNTFEVNAATVGSILTVRSVSGMIGVLTAPALSDRFTERKLVIIASVINVLGSLFVFFVNHIISFYVWAIIFGICSSYTLIPTQIIIGKYFLKWRSLAMSTSSTGGTLGQLILPPLCAFLMEKYSLFGAFLIVGGISLNCIAAGALQRPFEVQSKTRQNGNNEDETTNTCDALTKSSTSYKLEFEEQIETEQCIDVELVGENDDGNAEGTEISHECEDNMIAAINEQQPGLSNSSEYASSLSNNKNNDSKSRIDAVDIIPIPRVEDSNVPNVKYVTRTSVIDLEAHPTIIRPRNSSTKYEQTKRFLNRQFDMNLLKLPRFISVVLINAVSFGFLFGSKTFLISMTKERVVDVDLSLLLTVNACTDIPGRFVIAMIIDTKILQTHHVVLLCNLLAAVATCFYPLAKQYWSMMVVSAIMGLSSVTCAYLALPVVIGLVGTSRMSKGLGWHSFAMSISSQIILPFLGGIRDATGSYDAVFYISGGCIIALVLTYFTVNFIIEHVAREPANPLTKETHNESETIHLTI